MRGAAAGEKEVVERPAIRNTFGIGGEGVSPVSNIFSPAIKILERRVMSGD
jgi:hypothetical protein